MIKDISEMNTNENIVIDLTGPKGNAYYLLGMAQKYAKQLNLDSTLIQEKMKSGNYDTLIEVFDRYFGEYVTLYR